MRHDLFRGLLTFAVACGRTSSQSNGDASVVDVGNGDGGSGQDAPACATSVVTAQQAPLDLFIMLDQSGSMSDLVSGGGTKWMAVTDAITSFVQQTGLDGISVGLQYFALPASATCSQDFCTTDTDCGAPACGPCYFGICSGAIAEDSCTAADYAVAEVEIAPLPGVADELISSMNAHVPSTGTPTSAALQGAIDHAKSWATSHPSDVVAVVFATDGDPSECDTDQNNINALAAAGYNGTPQIRTFVIGVGTSLTALAGIAASGGTGQPYLVDTGGNVNQQVLAAMNEIRGTASCQFLIPTPTSGAPDYGQVNVSFTPMSGSAMTFPYVMSQASCPINGDGWYYDDPANPTHIILCDQSCGTVKGTPNGSVSIMLGCTTIIL
jgi:hypothetical protein